MQVSIKLLLGSLLLGSFSIIHAETLTVNAPVNAVTLYTNQADIIRKATINITQSGQQQLIIPALISANSEDVSVNVQGAELLNQSVVAGEALTSSASNAELNQAQEKLKVIQRALSDNAMLAKVLSNRIENPETNIDDIKERINSLRADYEELLRKEQQANDDVNRLTKLLQWQEENHDKELEKSLLLTINAQQPSEVVVTLRERSNRAYWQPASQWRLNSDTNQLDIVGQAKISQATGVDWDNVSITLAIMPMQYHYQPILSEQVISYANTSGMEDKSLLYQAEMPESLASKRADNRGLAAPLPMVVNNGGNFQVIMPDKYSLASGRDSYLMNYYHAQAHADTYSAFYSWDWPKEAVLMAQWEQPGELSLLAGEMKLYRDGLFLTNYNSNELLQAGSKQNLSFGVDSRIEVEVVSPPEYNKNNGFISRDRLLKKEENLNLINHSDSALPVRIYARLPVSTEESIDIKPSWSPKPDAVDTENVKGLVMWKKQLAPDETFSVKHAYEIRHPEDKTIIGMQ